MSEFEKPEAEFDDGNIFVMTGRARKALKRAGYSDKAEEMTGRVQKAQSYDEAVSILYEYVD